MERGRGSLGKMGWWRGSWTELTTDGWDWRVWRGVEWDEIGWNGGEIFCLYFFCLYFQMFSCDVIVGPRRATRVEFHNLEAKQDICIVRLAKHTKN